MPQIDFSSVQNLFKVTNRKEFIKKSKEIFEYAKKYHNPYFLYRLGCERDQRKLPISQIENELIKEENPYFILRFAQDIRQANIIKLQQAIINIGDYVYIAQFGCFIRQANKDIIEDVLVKSRSAKASYLYLKYAKNVNYIKFKEILLQSKRPRYLFLLATLTSDQSEIDIIQDLIIAGNSNLYVRLFAKYIPNADILKLEDRIIQSRDIREIKKFALEIGSKQASKLLLLF